MNHCIFMGNLVDDPKLDTINGAKGPISVVKFKIGVNNRPRDEAAFPFCEAWGQAADLIAQHFHKGDLIRVYCSLVNDNWIDKTTGEKRYKDKYRVERFEFPEGKKGATAVSTEEEAGPTDETTTTATSPAPTTKPGKKGRQAKEPVSVTDGVGNPDDEQTPW